MAYRIPEDVLSQRLDEATLLLDLRSGTYLRLSASGTFIWELLGDGADRDGIVAALAQRYGIEADRASRDTDAMIDELLRRQLLEAPVE